MIKRVIRSAFFQLYKKELMSKKLEFIVMASVVFLANMVMYINLNPSAASTCFIVLWILWSAYRSLGHEWEMNTSYLIMSLPISGAKILMVKLVSILTVFTAFLIEFGILGIPFRYVNIKAIFESISEANLNTVICGITDIILVYIYLLTIVAVMVVICQLSFILSRLVNKFSKVFVVVSAAVSIWVFFRVSYIISCILNLMGLPDLKILAGGAYINPGPIIAGLLLAAGFYTLAAKLYDNVIEV